MTATPLPPKSKQNKVQRTLVAMIGKEFFEDIMFNKINISFIGASICAAYGIYYALYVVHRPRLVAGPHFRQLLLSQCPLLSEQYWPTFWCFGGRPQTLVRAFLKSEPSINYTKEFLQFEDGGHAALDWDQNDESQRYKDKRTRPTVLLLPGLTGNSKESYLLHFVDQARKLGYRSVVFNNRGNGGADLKTARSYCATETDDLRAVIFHIKQNYPEAPLVAAGVSLGGIILSNYLTQWGRDSALNAAFTMSTAWDPFATSKSLEQPVNQFLFNSHLADNLKDMISKYQGLFGSAYDWDFIMKCSRVRDFDDRFTAKQFGYPSWKEYYADMNLRGKVNKIQTPLLAVNAHDDPFSPGESIPLEEIENSKYTSIVLTQYGGHIGFVEGMFPRHTSYVDRVFAQFIQLVFQNPDVFNKTFHDS